jgi:predicted ATPase
MHQEKLIVKNFFTIKNIEIELSKFNVFIGEQASGKSIIIKLIHSCRSFLSLPIEQCYLSTTAIKDLIIKQFNDVFNLADISKTINFEIKYFLNNKFTIQILQKGQNLSIEFSSELQDIHVKIQKKMKDLHKVVHDLNQNMNLTLERLNLFRNVLNEIGLESNIDPLPFIPAGRTFLVTLQRNIYNIINSINSDNKLDPLLLRLGQCYLDAIEVFGSPKFDFLGIKNQVNFQDIRWYDDKFSSILKGKYVYDQTGGLIEQDCGKVRPWHSSSGQQETLPLYLVLRYYLLKNRSGYLHIEEPETHLYPTAQKHIMEALVYLTNATSSSGLYITTHSPYILTVLNNLIMANDVKQKQPDFEPNLLVPFENVKAYCISNGNAHSLMNKEYRIIDAEKLDEVSNIISSEYSNMVDLL